MLKPTKNRVSYTAKQHGYPATDYSWHNGFWIARKDWVAFINATVKIQHNYGRWGTKVTLTGVHRGKTVRMETGHSERVYVKNNSKVKEGQTVGKMGHTGLPAQNGDHLHIEIYVSGSRVPDPDAWLMEQIEAEMLTQEMQNILYRYYLGKDPGPLAKRYINKSTFKQERIRIRQSKAYKSRIKLVKDSQLDVTDHLPKSMRVKG